MRKWPEIGLKCFLFNNTEVTGTSTHPIQIVTSVAKGHLHKSEGLCRCTGCRKCEDQVEALSFFRASQT